MDMRQPVMALWSDKCFCRCSAPGGSQCGLGVGVSNGFLEGDDLVVNGNYLPRKEREGRFSGGKYKATGA